MSAISPISPAASVLESLTTSKAADRFAFAVLLEIDLELNLFKDFLTFEYAEENLLFWREIFEYDQIVSANLKPGESLAHGSKLYKVLKRKTLKIANTFLDHGAPLSVNISGELRQKVLDNINSRKDLDNKLFDTARKEIEELMIQGAYPRFNKSKSSIIEESWGKICQHMSPDELGKILFMNWFMEAPEVMPRFKTNMSKHSRMWVDVFSTAVKLLSDLRNLIPKLIQLGEVHVRYGAHDGDFDKLQKAMIQTLDEVSEMPLIIEEMPLIIEERKTWEMVFKMMSAVMCMAMKRQVKKTAKNSLVASNAEEKSISMDVRNLSRIEMIKLLLFGEEFTENTDWSALDYHYDKAQFNMWIDILKFKYHCKHKRSSDAELIQEARELGKKHIESPHEMIVQFPRVVRASTQAELSKMGTTKHFKLYPGIFDDFQDILEASIIADPFPTVKKEYVAQIRALWKQATSRLSIQQMGKIIFITFFQNCPEVVPLFRSDIAKHGAMIAGMMDMAVSSIEELDQLIPVILDVGSRHFAYKAQRQYFDALGEALVETFKHAIKEDFTSEKEVAWRSVFKLLSHLMTSAMQMSENGHSGSNENSDMETTSSSDRSNKKKHKKNAPSTARNCIVM